jgi:hypothetical protein
VRKNLQTNSSDHTPAAALEALGSPEPLLVAADTVAAAAPAAAAAAAAAAAGQVAGPWISNPAAQGAAKWLVHG